MARRPVIVFKFFDRFFDGRETQPSEAAASAAPLEAELL